MVTYRPATLDDQVAILSIYNDAVVNTTATFDTEERSLQKQYEWFSAHRERHPVLVAVANSEVIGWASMSPWSDRSAYDASVEVSVYIHKDHRNKGIGSSLLELITLAGKEAGNHTVISRITSGNDISIHLHEKLGYRIVGTLKEVGFKFGRYLDVVILQFNY